MRKGIGVPERAQAAVVFLPRRVPERSVTKKHRRKGVAYHSSRAMGLPPTVTLTECGCIMVLTYSGNTLYVKVVMRHLSRMLH